MSTIKKQDLIGYNRCIKCGQYMKKNLSLMYCYSCLAKFMNQKNVDYKLIYNDGSSVECNWF